MNSNKSCTFNKDAITSYIKGLESIIRKLISDELKRYTKNVLNPSLKELEGRLSQTTSTTSSLSSLDLGDTKDSEENNSDG